MKKSQKDNKRPTKNVFNDCLFSSNYERDFMWALSVLKRYSSLCMDSEQDRTMMARALAAHMGVKRVAETSRHLKSKHGVVCHVASRSRKK